MLMMKQIELVEKNVKPDILIMPGMKKHLSIYSILLTKYLWEKEHIDSWKPQVMRQDKMVNPLTKQTFLCRTQVLPFQGVILC